MPMKGAPTEVWGEFTRCFWILKSQKLFGEMMESCFLEELQMSLSMIDVKYKKMLDERATSKAWRFSRRARTKLLELLAEHDRLTPFVLAETWSASRLNTLPFFTGKEVCEQLRSLSDSQHPLNAQKPAKDAEDFVRASYKFVLKPEDAIDFMWEVIPHLPLYVFKKNGQALASTHSIYLDGQALPLYHKKASKEPEGAVLLRLRWYDVDEPDHFFAEKKVSRNKFTREPSKKTRARIETSFLTDLLQGRLTGGPVLDAFQEKMQELRAKPVLRTTARRVCFQVPDDPSLRITVDLDFEAVIENSKNWRFQEKVSPYVHFSQQNAIQYPLAIVEVKVEAQGNHDPPMPLWLVELVKRRHMAEVNISKYLFAVASLLPHEISYVPEWFHASLSLHTELQQSKAPAVRIDPRTIIKTENLTLKWFGVATIPLGSVIVSSRRVPKNLHLVSLAFSMLFILYATRLYMQRVDQLSKGNALLPDRLGMTMGASCLCIYGVLYTVMIDFE